MKYHGVICKYEGCDRPAKNRGYCGKHYNFLWSKGKLPKITPLDRFKAHVGLSGLRSFNGTPCHEWTGSKTPGGYGAMGIGSADVYVHRWIYEQKIGPIPPGCQVDHLCHNADKSCAGGPSCLHRACVNELHLEAVPPTLNKQRGRAGPRTHCRKNHEYTPDNTYVDSRGKRRCITCDTTNARARWKRSRSDEASAYCIRCGQPLQINAKSLGWQHRNRHDRPQCAHPPEVRFA